MRILITGGAGFIGSHLTDQLLRAGHGVRVLDNLAAQVHGSDAGRPPYLDPDVELIRGDVRDAGAVRRALHGIDAVYHFAAAVGVGQSMYEIVHYTSTNAVGTAVLLEALSRQPVERLIVASSMSVYGEGKYRTVDGDEADPMARSEEDLRGGRWDPEDTQGRPLVPVATPEHKPPALSSVYALTKFDQERLCLMLGAAYAIPTVALRFFNVFGTRQALSNPYTGVLAIFASRLLNDRAPVIFEDGRQRRDFVAVSDVVRACRLALTAERAVGCAINVGSGRSATVLEVAELLCGALGKAIEPEISGQHRVGDIRHCFADITLATERLGYAPSVTLEAGLLELSEWLRDQPAVDRVMEASHELVSRGLTR